MNAKKLLTTLFSAVLTVTSLCPLAVFSTNYGDDEGWSYSIMTDENSEDYILIDGYLSYLSESVNSDSPELVIPEKIEDIPVREVKLSTVFPPVSPVSVTFPPTIEFCDISGYDFQENRQCSQFDENLKKVDFSENVSPVEFSSYSFFGTGIEELKLPPIRLSTIFSTRPNRMFLRSAKI